MSNTKYQITILNWDKYQREMQGSEKRRKRREWIAISVDLFSDPDFLAMDQCHRNAWVGLLCHAGKVGPVFELCPSDARLLLRLRKSPDFEVFKNQGFIDLQAATNKTYKTRQNKTNTKARKKPVFDEDKFSEFREIYPPRDGDQNWQGAKKAINSRLAQKHTWDEILDGARRYAAYCAASDSTGSRWVKQASTFVGPEKHFLKDWNPPKSKSEHKQDRNIEAGLQFLGDNNA